MKRKGKPTGWWHTRNTHLCKQVILSRIFKHMVLVHYSYQSQRSIRNLFFYLSSNSFASFLSQRSNLVHCSLHLFTWSPRFTSHDLYLRCQSPASWAKRSFYFAPPKINCSNSKLSLLWFLNLEKMEKNYKDINTTFILNSSLLSFNWLFASYNSTWKDVFIINTKEGSTHKKNPHVPSHVLLLCTYSLSFFSVLSFLISPDITLCGWLGSKHQLTCHSCHQ